MSSCILCGRVRQCRGIRSCLMRSSRVSALQLILTNLTDACVWPPRVPAVPTAAAATFPFSSRAFPPPTTCLSILTPPPILYIIALLCSSAAPRRHYHGNSGTTACWLLLLPGAGASQPLSGASAESMNQSRNIPQSQPNNKIAEGQPLYLTVPVCCSHGNKTAG